MPSSVSRAFERLVQITNTELTGEPLRQRLIRTAKEEVNATIQSGKGSPDYYRIINGRLDASEEQVRLPGPIVYRFSWLRDAALFAIAFLQKRWPVRGPAEGGHWQDAFHVLVDGHSVPPAQVGTLKPNEVMLVNTVPYSRKAEIGYKGFLLSEGSFEECAQALRRTYGTGLFKTTMTFVPLAGGYSLKTGRTRGKPMRYPTLLLTET